MESSVLAVLELLCVESNSECSRCLTSTLSNSYYLHTCKHVIKPHIRMRQISHGAEYVFLVYYCSCSLLLFMTILQIVYSYASLCQRRLPFHYYA